MTDHHRHRDGGRHPLRGGAPSALPQAH